MSRLGKALGFVALSLLYCAISLYFLVMFALGDCAAHDEIPPGRCWGDDVSPGAWAGWSLGGYLLMALAYWWLVRRRSAPR